MRGAVSTIALCCFALALNAASPARALDASDAPAVQIRAQLDRLPDELDGLRVRLSPTPRPRISVHNLTGDALEILDHAERPYLRIGPQNTHADFANAWFHRARFATDGTPPEDIGGAARWHKIDSGSAHGWWDPRLRITKDMRPPPGVTGGGPKFLRRWRIPVRLGDTTSSISGYFLYYPAPDGVYRAEIADSGGLGENVAVHPLLGKEPGVFIANHGNAEFTVRGMEGEPLLRFIPGKVMVNPSSATWERAAPRGTSVPYSGPGEPRWVVISTTGGFGWYDPRLRADGERTENGRPGAVKEWAIPAAVDGGVTEIEGRTWWLPSATADFGR